MIIRNCRYFDGEDFSDVQKDIRIDGGVITEVGVNLDKDDTIIDAGGNIACPGYVDIHTHGIAGFDNSDIGRAEIPDMASAYYRSGTTTFIPSFPTISSDAMCRALEEYDSSDTKIKGIHLEGPYINNQKRGAQNPVYIQKPSAAWFEKKYSAYRHLIKRITLAPEEDPGFAFAKYLIENGIKLSFGHTTCGADMAGEFFKLTETIATHTFNAMPSIHHRSPSITTVALNNDSVYCEIIPDLIHLHPEIIKMVFKLKGAGRTIIVSDSMLAAGLPYGEYDFSGLHVTVGEKGARLDSGNLAGSTITMAEGVQRTIACGINPADALAAATSTPARAMGMEKEAGYIRKGYPADIIILDRDYSVMRVFKDGRLFE